MNLQETDPEFMERFEHFALHEVVSEENQSLEEQTRSIVILAALIGCQGTDAYREMLPQALRLGVTPVCFYKKRISHLSASEKRVRFSGLQ